MPVEVKEYVKLILFIFGKLLQVNQSKNRVAPGPFTKCLVNAEISINPTFSLIALASFLVYSHHLPLLKLLELRSLKSFVAK